MEAEVGVWETLRGRGDPPRPSSRGWMSSRPPIVAVDMAGGERSLLKKGEGTVSRLGDAFFST